MADIFPISRGELESLRYRLKEADELVEPLTHENDHLKAQLVDLRTTIAQQQDTINRQAAELAEASELLEQADKRIGEATAANNAALRRIQSIELRFDRYAASANRTEKIKDARITELERQLSATLTTIEAAAWCNQCNLPADHCRENHDGALYAEGCAP